MSKHKLAKPQGAAGNARARLAAEKAAAERRRRRMILVIVPLAVIVVAVGVLVGVKVLGIGRSTAQTASGTAGNSVVSGVTSVPASVLDKVGAGTANAFPKAIPGTPLTENGKPKVLYVGAEYCPFCAAERWSTVVALSRFGTFSNLGQSASSPQDVYPSTATLSFHGSSYTSSTIAFEGVETQAEQGVPLDTLPAEGQKLVDTYDAPPYVPKESQGSIPFVYIGGKYMISGATYSPQVLQGKTHEQIAAALSNPDSAVAQAVDGSANVITAAICATTKNAPADVCSAAGVQAAAKKLS